MANKGINLVLGSMLGLSPLEIINLNSLGLILFIPPSIKLRNVGLVRSPRLVIYHD